MATYNSNKMVSGTQPKILTTASGVRVYAFAALPTALLVNDIINMVALASDVSNPNGLGPTILGMAFGSDDLDSNVAPLITLDLGDSGSTTRYFSASTVAQNGGTVYPSTNFLGYQPLAASFGTYTTPSYATYTIFATVRAAPATWQAGSVKLAVEYTYDP